MIAVCSSFGEHLRSRTSVSSTVRLHGLNRKTVGADCSLLLVLQRKCSLLKVKRCLEMVWLSFSSHRDPLFTFVDSGIIVEVFFPGLISSILFFPREESILNKFYVR